jgi:endonuclease/exonuclease/phosphatase family metal-dependent hydrolase
MGNNLGKSTENIAEFTVGYISIQFFIFDAQKDKKKTKFVGQLLFMKNLFFGLGLFFSVISFSQTTDTIRVMSYNLLKFPDVNAGRIADLKIVLQEALPDILVVCEITSSSGANAVQSDALNENGITHYEKASYVSGPDTENMLYYNSDKLALKEQNVISTNLRDINEYVLYYLSDDIASTSDTTFFFVYACHLKASQGEEAERNSEALAMKNYMSTRGPLENILVAGDMNLYGSSEPAWTTITSSHGITLLDPINTPGDWHADWGYANIHTQSTRTTTFDGGAIGGMDDRFDFIFMSEDLQNWGAQARYISGSYWAYGQDGNRYNGALIDAPTNISLPSNVIQALYDMSDHLPVYMEIEVQKTYNSIPEDITGVNAYYRGETEEIIFDIASEDIHLGQIHVYDLSGKEVLSTSLDLGSKAVDVSVLEKGVYVLKEDKYNFSMKFMK